MYCILEYGLHNVAVHARVFGLLAESLLLIRRHEADEWLLFLASTSKRLVYRRLAKVSNHGRRSGTVKARHAKVHEDKFEAWLTVLLAIKDLLDGIFTVTAMVAFKVKLRE